MSGGQFERVRPAEVVEFDDPWGALDKAIDLATDYRKNRQLGYDKNPYSCM